MIQCTPLKTFRSTPAHYDKTTQIKILACNPATSSFAGRLLIHSSFWHRIPNCDLSLYYLHQQKCAFDRLSIHPVPSWSHSSSFRICVRFFRSFSLQFHTLQFSPFHSGPMIVLFSLSDFRSCTSTTESFSAHMQVLRITLFQFSPVLVKRSYMIFCNYNLSVSNSLVSLTAFSFISFCSSFLSRNIIRNLLFNACPHLLLLLYKHEKFFSISPHSSRNLVARLQANRITFSICILFLRSFYVQFQRLTSIHFGILGFASEIDWTQSLFLRIQRKVCIKAHCIYFSWLKAIFCTSPPIEIFCLIASWSPFSKISLFYPSLHPSPIWTGGYPLSTTRLNADFG